MGQPLISIIMGVYNCALTLPEAVDSILAQTYPNWELIMCDDGSSDDTFAVAERFRSQYPDKIVLLRNEKNLGLNCTLNNCISVARGEYIARMDGDDISLPERFEKELEFLQNHSEYALVSTPMIYFDEAGEWGKGNAISFPKKKDFAFSAPCFCHAPCMMRKDAMMAVGGYIEDQRFLRFEDCNLWYKLYSAGYVGANLSEALYKMRDDRNAYKRRTVSTRLRAVFVQFHGFRMIKMDWYYYPVLVKELAKGLILSIMPMRLYNILHRARLENKHKD